jgi:hypothetical protein
MASELRKILNEKKKLQLYSLQEEHFSLREKLLSRAERTFISNVHQEAEQKKLNFIKFQDLFATSSVIWTSR